MTAIAENVENTTYLDELCRICAVKCSILDVSVYSDVGQLKELQRKLDSCLPISVREHDPFPKRLCESCCYQLEAFYDFRRRSLESENYFNNLLKKSAAVTPGYSSDSFAHIDFEGLQESEEKERKENFQYILESDDILIKVEGNGSQFIDNLSGNEIINFDQTMLSDSNIFNLKMDQKEDGALTMNSESLPSDLNFEDQLSDMEDGIGMDMENHQDIDGSESEESPRTEDIIKTVEPEVENSPKESQKKKSKACSVCQKTFQNNFKLSEHILRHSDPKPYKCSFEGCSKGFQSKIGRAQHEATHKGVFLLTCDKCGKGFQCQSYLTVHQRVHSDFKPFACATCGMRFKAKATLVNHENRHMGIQPFKCSICQKGFVTKALCQAHENTHTSEGNQKYPCTVCRKMFVCKSYLKVHMRIHTNDRPFECEVCGKKFLTNIDLKSHQQVHTKEKKHFCEICGKNFSRKDTLNVHRRTHSGERPYKCLYCDDTFTKSSIRNVHMKLHTGERPFGCPVDNCAKRFVSKSTMMTHIKRHCRQK
ncbi:zinc finger protein OZF-like [Phlebotomus argentipes]|uniref:zinc finger protein OZF-like n=1 Tax=Phlebotomus argentipes TaxID=94469 RepID=UPI002892C6F7|nr:zinc finger protein OZF-like [Phlebotomus argentipes]